MRFIKYTAFCLVFTIVTAAIGNSLNGRITSQANDPRLLQMAGRLNF